MTAFYRNIWLLFFFCLSTAHAQQEQWYAYWGVGAGNYSYPGSVDSNYDAVTGSSRDAFTIDSWGFYWPVSQGVLLGFILTDSFDSVSGTVGSQSVTYEKEQGVYSISAMKYFGHDPGTGWFIRGDLGGASVITRTSNNYDTGEPLEEGGIGILLGAGYGYPISDGTNLLVTLQYSLNSVDSGEYSSTRILAGILW